MTAYQGTPVSEGMAAGELYLPDAAAPGAPGPPALPAPDRVPAAACAPAPACAPAAAAGASGR